MKIAIYSRKSKITEKGDSIHNQVNICKKYINTHYQNSKIIIYEDEGFSGGTTERPQFKKLLKDINDKQLDILVCYRLDRISRNVIDFSTTLELLQEKNVGFVSIKESFDTTSPMGRAMVYISSVFSQLERETIGERIRDNLEELAKSGRYLGSKPPLGYKKKKIEYIDKNNNTKSYNTLEIDEKYSDFIKDLFEKYLALQSLSKLETYYMQNNVRTKLDKFYTPSTIKRILIHPLYTYADKYTYNYFLNLGCNIVDPLEKFNGKKGINIYRFTRSIKKASKINDPKNWIIGVGSHTPIISSLDWIKTQQILEARKSLTIKRTSGKFGMLSGVLKCGTCGSYMRPVSLKKNRFYYSCTTKEKSKGQLCTIKNVRGDILDKKILQGLLSYYITSVNNSVLLKRNYFVDSKKININTINRLQKEIDKNKDEINILIQKLSLSSSKTIEKYIEEHVEKLHNKNSNIIKEIENLKNNLEICTFDNGNTDDLVNIFDKIKEKDLDFTTRRNMLKDMIKEIIYREDCIFVEFLS